MTRSKVENGEKVWNAFRQMKDYLSNDVQIISSVDEDNRFQGADGKLMYDGVSTLLNTNLGHKNKEVIRGIVEQLDILDASTLFTCTSQVALDCARKLCEFTGDHYHSVFFTNSGSEACDTAIKIVLKYWKNKGEKRSKIVSLTGAYHGSSIGAMMLAHGYYPMDDYSISYENFHQTPQPDPLKRPEKMTQEDWINCCVDRFEKYCEDNRGQVAAFFFEPIQLSNAANVLPGKFVSGICDCCRAEGILIVVDEVATGFGRTGNLFAIDDYGEKADLMMMAKGISSGYIPMGAVMATEEIYRGFYGKTSDKKQLDHGYTTGGHPLACAAALKTMEIFEQTDCVKNAKNMGEHLIGRLREEIGSSFLVREIRGKGLMLSVIFEEVTIRSMEEWGVAEILSSFLINKGLLLYPDSASVLIVAPPLNVTKEECDLISREISEAVGKIEFLMK